MFNSFYKEYKSKYLNTIIDGNKFLRRFIWSLLAMTIFYLVLVYRFERYEKVIRYFISICFIGLFFIILIMFLRNKRNTEEKSIESFTELLKKHNIDPQNTKLIEELIDYIETRKKTKGFFYPYDKVVSGFFTCLVVPAILKLFEIISNSDNANLVIGLIFIYIVALFLLVIILVSNLKSVFFDENEFLTRLSDDLQEFCIFNASNMNKSELSAQASANGTSGAPS